jgi:hypothetical protein
VGDDEPDVPSLNECRQQLADWARFVRTQLDRADRDIEAMEKLLDAGEDKLTVRGSVEQMIGGAVGVGGIITTFPHPIVGAIVAVVAVLPMVNGAVRNLGWKKQRRNIRELIRAAKGHRKQWELEERDVERARRRIEGELALESRGAQPSLPTGKRKRRRRKRRDSR